MTFDSGCAILKVKRTSEQSKEPSMLFRCTRPNIYRGKRYRNPQSRPAEYIEAKDHAHAAEVMHKRFSDKKLDVQKWEPRIGKNETFQF